MLVCARLLANTACSSPLLPLSAQQQQSSADPPPSHTCDLSSRRLVGKSGWIPRGKINSSLSAVGFFGDAERAVLRLNGNSLKSAVLRSSTISCECLKRGKSECSSAASFNTSSSSTSAARQRKLERVSKSESIPDSPLDERSEKGFLESSLDTIVDFTSLAPILAAAVLIFSCGLFSPRAALAEKKLKAPLSAALGVALSPREQSPGAQLQDGEKRDPEPFPKIARFHLNKQLDDPKDDQTALALKRYLESNPGDRNALKSLLHLRMTKGDVGSSIEVLNELVEAEPDVVEWKYIRAQALEVTGDFDAAREGFEQILQEDPYSARALQGLATVMQKTGEDSLVLEMLEGAVQKAVGAEKRKEATNLKMLLGQVHMTQGNLEEALRQYKEISDEDPKDFRPHLCQGLVYSIIGQLDEADSHFKQFRALCPPNFPNRGYLDDMMLRAKTESRRLEDKKKQDAVLKKRGRHPRKPLQQPKAGGPPQEGDD